MPHDDRAYCPRLLAARIPEITVDELMAALEITPAPDTLPAPIAEQIFDVIEALEDKLDYMFA